MKKIVSMLAPLFWWVEFTTVIMPYGNRMFRPISIGTNDHRWYVRTDWWWIGVRASPSAALRAKWAIWGSRNVGK